MTAATICQTHGTENPCLQCRFDALVATSPIALPEVSPNPTEKIVIASMQANATESVDGAHPWQKQVSAIFQPSDYLHILLIHGTETFIGRDGNPHPKTQEHWDSYESVMSAGSLEALQNWERQGWNIFICTAVFDAEKIRTAREAKQPRRVSANIATDANGKHIVRCIAIDCDADGKASLNKIGEAVKVGLVPTPTVVIRSSTPSPDKPDAAPKYHVWWATKGLTLEQQAALNTALQEQFGGDPAAKDTVRVLRLAGFINNQPTKYPHKPVTELVRCNKARYTFEDFKLSVNVKPLNVARPKASSDRMEFYCNQIETNAAEAGFDLGDAEPYLDGGFKWVQTECPNADAHTTGVRNGSFLILMPSGAKSFGCLHAHCKGENGGTLLNWERFKNHLNALAGEELDWTEKGMLVTHDEQTNTAVEGVAEPVEDVKATSLLVLQIAADVAYAKELGFHSLLASDFVLPVPADFAFRRFVLVGIWDKTFAEIAAGVSGKGAVYIPMPFKSNGKVAEQLTDVPKEEVLAYFKWQFRCVASADIRKPKTHLVEVPVDSANANETSAADNYNLTFKYPALPNPPFDFVVKTAGATDGWFPLGDPSLIGGPSGSCKSTFMIDLLESQSAGEPFLDCQTYARSYLILMSDRGENAHLRTAARMRLKSETPIRFIGTLQGPSAIQDILQKIEACDPIPQVVFIEGLDMLVEDANKLHIVTPFLEALQKIAKHYHIALIGSVGSGKAKKGQEYAAARDKIFGSIAWSRKSETIVVIEYEDGDDTADRRRISVLLRNGKAEKYRLKMVGGRLVVDHLEPKKEEERKDIIWFRLQGKNWFTLRDYQNALGCSKTKSYEDIKDAQAKHILVRKKQGKNQKGEAYQWRWNDKDTNPENDNFDPEALDENEE